MSNHKPYYRQNRYHNGSFHGSLRQETSERWKYGKYGDKYGEKYGDKRGDKHDSHSPYHRLESPVTNGNGSSKPLPIAPNEITGTDITTGENVHDEKFPKLYIHSQYLSQIQPHPVDIKKNYKVVYDPELDKSLSKSEKKSKQKKVKFYDESQSHSLLDPRMKFTGGGLEAYLYKPNKRSKKFPFKQLPQPKFIYDKDSLGPLPLMDLVVWELPSTISEVYLINFFKSYGNSIKDLKIINDPDNGVPLGIATFKFQGSPEKSARLATKVIEETTTNGMKIDGSPLKIDLNDHDNKLLDTKIKIAQSRLRISKIKRDEEEKKFRLQQESKKRKQLAAAAASASASVSSPTPNGNNTITPATPQSPAQSSDKTILSSRQNNKTIPGIHLPTELAKYIKNRPYIIIQEKYVPTKKVSTQDIKKVLNRYDWTRVLSDKSGFFVVFNSLKECERCFYKEDGRKFYEYRLFMELALPQDFLQNDHHSVQKSKSDVINDSTNMLIKEFQNYLSKDIRERIIAPTILDLLSDDKYPSLIKELKAKEAESKKVITPPVFTTPKLKENALSVLASRRTQNQPLPSFKKKPTKLPGTSNRKSVIPMLHALNYDEEEDDDEDDEEEGEETKSAKRPHDKEPEEPHKKKKLMKNILYDSSEEEEDQDKPEEQMSEEQVLENEDIVEEGESLLEIYRPTTDIPRPVYEDIPPGSNKLDFDLLQEQVKDQEDYELLNELLRDTEPDTSVKNLEYWAWKTKEGSRSDKNIVLDETVDLEGPLSSRLNSETGAFKSDGYKKILDSDKIEYLPHRRKVHKPLKTVQVDEEKSGNDNKSTNNGSNNSGTSNVQSSRVNRANNRRFAADISAQKQLIGTETDILNLNTLTKRKKPVSFARSAIHNWGLYALEPIAAKDMIIEYVGESIRQQVAEHREKSYIKTGIGSSYLFRIDENTVIDATKKGGIARFINHCCSPSCTAKIIKVEGKKRIVIYALRDIDANEELTYDYKFEREINDNERIPCLCGAPGCKGYLN